MKRPTTTGGSPIPVFTSAMTSRRPGKRASASKVPSGMPIRSERTVAVPDSRSDSHVIPRTSGSPRPISSAARTTPSQISATRVASRSRDGSVAPSPRGRQRRARRARYPPTSSSRWPAIGTNSGCPYLSTPKVLMTACTAGDSMKSAKAFPAAALTRGPLAGLTSMTE